MIGSGREVTKPSETNEECNHDQTLDLFPR
jgi:hypothetical protein